MSNQKNNKPACRQAGKATEMERRMLPFAVEFVKFFVAFVFIIASALLTLHFAVAAL
ncbi:MAG: hypothetical protein V1711_00755 [bacterium]